LPNSLINGLPQRVETLPGYLINGIVAPESNNGRETVEHWVAILTQLAAEQERRERPARTLAAREVSPREQTGEVVAHENRGPLQPVAAGPWRSLGGYFDYSHWAERERFLELDRAIAAGQDLRDASIDRDPEMI